MKSMIRLATQFDGTPLAGNRDVQGGGRQDKIAVHLFYTLNSQLRRLRCSRCRRHGDTATQRGTCCTRQTRRRLHGQPEELVCVQVWHGGYNWAHVIKFVIGLCGFPGRVGGGERESPSRSTRHSEQSVSPLSVCHMPSFPQLPFRSSIFPAPTGPVGGATG